MEILARKIKNFGHEVSEEDLIIMILHNLPKEYENIVEILENEMENDDLNLLKVKERLSNKYNKIKKLEKNFGNDVGLAANERKVENHFNRFKKPYKKQCYTCGELGHKGHECPKKEGNEAKKFENYKFLGRCHLCNEVGHKKWNCPKGKKMDSANTTVEKEIVLVGIEKEVPDNMWICDSGATCHMIGEDYGLTETKTIENEVIVGDGRKLKANKMGNLKVEFKQNNGESIEITLKDVKLVEGLKYNLFSLNSALKLGAKIRSEGEEIRIEKEGRTLKFDKKKSKLVTVF